MPKILSENMPCGVFLQRSILHRVMISALISLALLLLFAELQAPGARARSLGPKPSGKRFRYRREPPALAGWLGKTRGNDLGLRSIDPSPSFRHRLLPFSERPSAGRQFHRGQHGRHEYH